MNEPEEIQKTQMKADDQDPTLDSVEEGGNESPAIGKWFLERVKNLLNSTGQRDPGTKQELAKDRTRSLVLVIGGTIGAVLVFMSLFSTPATPNRETGARAAPNLGKPAESNKDTPPKGSVTPLLNADVRSDPGNPNQLGPADIRDTSPRATGSDDISPLPETTPPQNPSPRVSRPQAKGAGTVSSPGADGDPLAAYRLNNNTRTPTYSYGGPSLPAAGSGLPANDDLNRLRSAPTELRRDAPVSKSSIVFVRTPASVETAERTQRAATTRLEETSLLPPGTRLAARLEAAATTAVKTPVVASIEYNYERNGMIVVPAGATAIGDVQQASPEGYLNVRFHTLRMPDGREESIEGTALALDHGPLKGSVSGKNTGKKFLSRTLSGVGTIAAYVVGAGGAGLSGAVTGGTLLRDRLANNIALAGEQEMMNATYAQSISVTVPANTRFYVVLQKPAVRAATPASSRIAQPSAQPPDIPSVQELRELMDLRREINRMYQESNSPTMGGPKP